MKYILNKCTVSFGSQTVLKDIDFEIKGHEKIALTGRNGAGKTTLLRLICGEIEADRDDSRKLPEKEMSGRVTFSMLTQTDDADPELTVAEYVMLPAGETDGTAAGAGASTEDKSAAWSGESAENRSVVQSMRRLEFVKVFTGLGFKKEDMNRPLSSFSGGERTRIRLAKVLLSDCDILLLDEPTNHLDIKSTEWLENYIRNYPKAVLIISHDRFFLDRTVSSVYDLENGRLTYYPGNYSAFREEKLRRNAAALKTYEHYCREIERLNGLVERFKNKPRKAAFAASRRSIMARMEKIEKPSQYTAHIFTGEISPLKPGSRKVFSAEKLTFGYGQPLISELCFEMQRGRKTAVLGANGAGKTTFLKVIAGELTPLAGKLSMGNGTDIGYFNQQTADFTSPETVLSYFAKNFPALDEKKLRAELANYLFKGRDVIKKINDLSGGERSRLVLAKLLNEGHNFLMLDEPTNHMDTDAKETLESAFEAYSGSILFVSHDRYFVSRVADSLLIFENGSVFYYPFGYEHYIEMKERAENGTEDGDRPVCLGMMSAEDEAMLARLKSVPKRECHEIGFASAAEAGFDWSMRLADEALEEALKREEKFLTESYFDTEIRSDIPEQLMLRELKEREEALTWAYIAWYEVWLQGNEE